MPGDVLQTAVKIQQEYRALYKKACVNGPMSLVNMSHRACEKTEHIL